MNKLTGLRLTIINPTNAGFWNCLTLAANVVLTREIFSGTNSHGCERTWRGETGTGRIVEMRYFEGRMTLSVDQANEPGYQFAWQILSQVKEIYGPGGEYCVELLTASETPAMMNLAEAIQALDRQAQEDLLNLKNRLAAEQPILQEGLAATRRRVRLVEQPCRPYDEA